MDKGYNADNGKLLVLCALAYNKSADESTFDEINRRVLSVHVIFGIL